VSPTFCANWTSPAEALSSLTTVFTLPEEDFLAELVFEAANATPEKRAADTTTAIDFCKIFINTSMYHLFFDLN
jgi:hypothetical protein